MLSRRVDLTENREFSGGMQDTPFLPDEVLTREDIHRVNIFSQQNIMSTDDYEELLKFERMFGRRSHYNDIMDLKSMDEESFRIEMETHCQRCGKELKTPWNNFYDLCRECNEEIEWFEPIRTKKFPWTPVNIGVGWGRENDILHLR